MNLNTSCILTLLIYNLIVLEVHLLNINKIILGLVATMLLAGCKGHTHSFDSAWKYDEKYHWHEATCNHDEVSEKGEHTFEDKVIAPTDDADGYTTHTCSVCDYSYKDTPTSSINKQKALGIIPSIDIANKKLTYGLYPQTHVSDISTLAALANLTTPDPNTGWYLYNGAYYAKEVAIPYANTYTFSDGTEISNNAEYWFKCEPIQWNILSSSNGTYSLVSTFLLDATFYSYYANNYEDSFIRSWLNSDFLSHAFNLNRSYIDMTTVDNSADTTDSSSNPYASDNTNDRIYLLSYKDYVNSNYFSSLESRKSKTTDYALAKTCYRNNDGCGHYWTRSPNASDVQYVRCVGSDGSLSGNQLVNYKNNGIRAGMTIKYSA